ncbi:MAG: 4-alpha-glucanotransferase, partial [Deltaproteobacteria bacterium]|nr:4-alpha-glucanotransferase [Deltaproteobacteria bacterium]
DYDAFRAEAAWADEAVLFAVLRRAHDEAPFTSWAPGLRDRDDAALDDARETHREAYEAGMAAAFFFDRQWARLRRYARERDVQVLGDLPIYVSGESADVWAHRSAYQLDAEGHALRVAAVPPDAFSDVGQLWGNPLWDWDALGQRGYDVWLDRVGRALTLADGVRLDHFRAFSAYYSVAAHATDARDGEWQLGPRDPLFDALRARFGALPMVAEDLGLIDEEVHLLRGRLGLPGMRVLQFAFGGGDHELHLPWHHPEDSVAYTGTHDNDTTLGYWLNSPQHVRDHIMRSLGCADVPEQALHALINAALRSRAKLAILPAQDLLALGSEARMNTPGVAKGNWRWRMTCAQLEALNASFYRGWLEDADRHPQG